MATKILIDKANIEGIHLYDTWRKNGGYAVAVHPPGKNRTKCTDLFNAGRCDFFAPADYRRGSDLFKRTCLLLDRMLADIRVQEEMWRLSRGSGAAKT